MEPSVKVNGIGTGRVTIVANGEATYRWAAGLHPAGTRWPCSQLSRKGLVAEFVGGDLVDGDIPEECSSDELNAFIEFVTGTSRPE